MSVGLKALFELDLNLLCVSYAHIYHSNYRRLCRKIKILKKWIRSILCSLNVDGSIIFDDQNGWLRQTKNSVGCLENSLTASPKLLFSREYRNMIKKIIFYTQVIFMMPHCTYTVILDLHGPLNLMDLRR